jgi:hypothetical protein
MESDPPSAPDRTDDVMAAIDEESGVPRLVIADVSTDESWLSAPADAAACLAELR